MTSRIPLNLEDFIAHADFMCEQVAVNDREYVVNVLQMAGIAEVLISNDFEKIAAVGKPDVATRFKEPSYVTFLTENDYEYDADNETDGVASELLIALRKAASGETVSLTVNDHKVYLGTHHMVSPFSAP